ncbi:MAG: hypothetical protein HY308_09820 [Gammaproteobacteria bacterium]|nr:hypothetical protein [Gammaproteobacteria bacterium]
MKIKIKTKLKEGLSRLNAPNVGPRRIALHLPRGWPETDASVYWHAPTRDASERSGRAADLTQLPNFVRAAPVHIWTPAAETLLTRATIPTKARGRILQALPYALEEQLLDEPDQLHFSYVREADGTLAVAVTRRARLTLWLDTLHSAGIRPVSLCPGHLALPLQSHAWSVAFVGTELWVRTGAFAGFTVLAVRDTPTPLLVAAIKEAVAQERAPQSLMIYGAPATLDVEAWSNTLGLPVGVDGYDYWPAATVPALNLMQAEFSPGGSHLQQVVQPLRPAIIMLCLWLIGMLTVDVIEWVRLRQAHSAITAEMRDILQRSFPEAKAAIDPAATMQKHIDALQARSGGPADLLPLLARVAPTLQAAQGTAKLQGIRYGERSLTLDITLPKYEALDAMKNTLKAASLEVEVLTANSRGSEVEGRLRIQPAGARLKPRQRT